MKAENLSQIIDHIAISHKLDESEIVQVIEGSLGSAAKLHYGDMYKIRAMLIAKTGEIKFYKYVEVISNEPNDEIEAEYYENKKNNHYKFITLEKAKKTISEECAVGDYIIEQIPDIDSNRILAQRAKKTIISSINALKRSKELLIFEDKIDTLVTGKIVGIEKDRYIVQIGSSELVLMKNKTSGRDKFSLNTEIKACVYKVQANNKSQIALTRTSTTFIKLLLTDTISEISDNIISIQSIARIPGYKTKIAVSATQARIKAVATCIGIGGYRIKNIRQEIRNEIIDIFEWSSDIATLITNGIGKDKIQDIHINSNTNTAHISLANGIDEERVNKDLYLVSKIANIKIKTSPITSSDDNHSDKLMEAIEVDSIISMLLTSIGYDSVEKIAQTDKDKLISESGMSEELVTEIIRRCKAVSEDSNAEQNEQKENTEDANQIEESANEEVK